MTQLECEFCHSTNITIANTPYAIKDYFGFTEWMIMCIDCMRFHSMDKEFMEKVMGFG
jgi:hypothetical protein